MKFLRYILLTLCFFPFCSSERVLAENEDYNQRFSPQEFMKRQEVFISVEAGLTTQEAAAFFPLMREKEKQDRAIRQQMDNLIKKSHNANLPEKECREILEKMGVLDLQRTKMENSYRQKYKKVLSAKKILKVLEACGRFDRVALKNMIDHQWRGRLQNQKNKSKNRPNND